MAKKLALNSKIGVLGEEIAEKFLMKHGFSIVFRNYLKKWGEIDIVAEKRDRVFFVEVKSVSCERLSHETCGLNPAESVHSLKLERIKKAIQSYLMEYKVDSDWEIHVLSVHINKYRMEAYVEWLDRDNV